MSIAQTVAQQIRESSWIRRMFEEGIRLRAERGAENVFDYSLGNPDPEPPVAVMAAAKALVLENRPRSHAYMPNAGFPEVRAVLAARLAQATGLPYSADHVLMTVGAAGALNTLLKAVLDPGDEVIVLAPFFPEYRFYIENHGGRMVLVETREDFTLDLDRIAAALGPRTKAVLLNSPNNPTGAIYAEGPLRALAALLARQAPAALVISDEPYKAILYDGNAQPELAPLMPRTVIASSWSKQWAVPGERIGYLAISPTIAEAGALAAACTFAHRTLGFVNAPALWQLVVAQVPDACVDVALYQQKLDLLCSALRRIGYEFTRPKGAFYVFPRTPLADDVVFIQLLRAEGILAVPGSGFGRAGHMRLSLTLPFGAIERSLTGFANAYRIAKQRA
ncbi:MAG TPA: pyridoxal phosphate-dependent aminotransferase [Opitutaceae bacterium]|nr:pyridoxal phosphate-dependent aminotransferase [Opitutaceae bacterium]